MGVVVKPNTFSSNTTALASEVNANFDALYTLVNGNLDGGNLADGAVTENKLGALSVSTGKIAAGAVTDAKVAASAGIAVDKLAALTATIVPITDASGFLSSSAVTPTELGYVSGVTSAIQTQIDAKAADADLTTLESTVTSHTSDTNNPHSVTAADVGSVTDGDDAGLTLWAGFIDVSNIGGSPLPTGWSASVVDSGDFQITHTLGHTDYVVVPAARSNGSAFANSNLLTSTTFNLRAYSDTGAAVSSDIHFYVIEL